jgi:hypothetical protein
MTTRQICISLTVGIFWAAFVIWWSADYSSANILILSVMGIIFGFAWTWFMKRLGYFPEKA